MQSIQILNLQRGKSPPRCNLQAVFRYPLPRATFYIIRKLELHQSCASILTSQNREIARILTMCSFFIATRIRKNLQFLLTIFIVIIKFLISSVVELAASAKIFIIPYQKINYSRRASECCCLRYWQKAITT